MGLKNVFPSNSVNDLPSGGAPQAVLFCQFLYVSVLGAFRSYFSDLFFRQNRIVVCLSVLASALQVAIFHIVLKRSQKQVAWTNTTPIVAGVKNGKTLGNRTIGKLIRDTMGRNRTRAYSESPVPALVNVSRPNPASFCFFDFSPKSFHFGRVIAPLQGGV